MQLATDAEVIVVSWASPLAFEEIFTRHFEAIYGYLARRTSDEEAEDLAAETFATAFAHRRRYDPDRPHARPWLYGIAANLLRHHLRSRSRGSVALTRAAFQVETPDEVEDLASRLDADRDAARVLDAVDQLGEQEREVMLLVVWEGLSYQDVAEALDVPVGTVRSRLHRARQHLRDALAAAAPAGGARRA